MPGNDAEKMVTIRDVRKAYKMGEVDVPVLSGVSLDVARGSFTSVVGASGSGKTTLLSLIGGLDRPDSGNVVVAGDDVTSFSRRQLATYRRRRVGFVFQFYNLLPTLTALENVQLGLEFHGDDAEGRRQRAAYYLQEVGMREMAGKYPHQLSGGEQQRLAIARALARQPDLLLADEPTGNVDHSTALRVFQLIKRLQHERAVTCLVATHDAELASQTDRTVLLRDGRITE